MLLRGSRAVSWLRLKFSCWCARYSPAGPVDGTMSKDSYDVVIVGAGIVGAACADAFAARGLHVAVVDREVVGSGATAAGMGHIVVMDDSDAQFALTHYSQRLWHELR